MMRFAFWRKGKEEAQDEPVVERPAPAPVEPIAAVAAAGELDVRALGQALARRRTLIIIPTLLALVTSLAAVNLITPRYKSEARILIDGRENIFLRPNGERNEDRAALD